MFDIKRYIGYLSLFSIINLSIIGVSRQTAFYSLLSIVYPYIENSHTYNFVLFALNISIALIFVSGIIKNADEQKHMNNYILVRTSRKNALCIGIFRNLKSTALIFFTKILADFLLSQMNKTENLLEAVIAEVSIFLTLIVWTLFIYIMIQKHMAIKWIYFYVICSVIVFQYFSMYVSVFTLFVFGSPFLKALPAVWLILKSGLIIILFFVNVLISKKYEQLNIKNEY